MPERCNHPLDGPASILTLRKGVWVHWSAYVEAGDVSRPVARGVAHTHWGARRAARRALKRKAENSNPNAEAS